MSQSNLSRLYVSENSDLSSGMLVSVKGTSLAGAQQFVSDSGLRGKREHSPCRRRLVSDKSAGAITGNFSYGEIDFFLKQTFGTASSPWKLEDTQETFYALVDKVAALYKYQLYVDSLEISGSELGYINWAVNCVGGIESEYGSAFPSSPAMPECGNAYVMPDMTFTYDGTEYKLRSFKLTISNSIDPNLHENALTPTLFESQDFTVMLEAQAAFRSDTKALYRAAVAGAAASLKLDDGEYSYNFAFANLHISGDAPTVPERGGRIEMPIKMEASRSANLTNNNSDRAILVTKTDENP